MSDEIIRVILEAKDKLSKTVQDTERNVNKSFGNISNDLSKLDRNWENSSNNFVRRLREEDGSIKLWGNSIRQNMKKVQDELDRTRVKFNETNIAAGKVGRGSGGRFTSIAQGQQDVEAQRQQQRQQSPIGQFRAGLQAAKQTEKLINDQIAATQNEIKQKKIALDAQIRQERIAGIESDALTRDTTRKNVAAEKEGLEERISIAKDAEAKRELERKEALEGRILLEQKAFDKLKDEGEADLRSKTDERRQSFIDDQVKRENKLLKDQQEVRASNLTPTQRQQSLLGLRQDARQAQREAINARDADIRTLQRAQAKINDDNQASRDLEIEKLKAANASERKKDSDATDLKIQKEKVATQSNIKDLETETQQDIAKRKAEFETEAKRLKAAVSGEGKAGVLQGALSDTEDIRKVDQDTSRLAQTFKKAGVASGDFFRGIRAGRSDLRSLDKDARSLDTTLGRIGQSIGSFTKNIGNLVNLKWFLLISALQIVGQLVIVLAANLVSLASSAVLAAGALGVGLLSALSQLIPVAGLLFAAFSRIKAAFAASQQQGKSSAQSSQDIKAHTDAERQAQQSLSDALYAQAQAYKSLAAARQQASRDIVDATFAQRDAALSLQEAEFGVLDAEQQLADLRKQQQASKQDIADAQAAVKEAKERLAAAQKEGDQAEIEAAHEQLAVAQQNLAASKGQQSGVTKRQIAEQQEAVKRAKLERDQARVDKKRTDEDSKKTIDLGVKGSAQVVDALHAVATANRDVANAQRGVITANQKQASTTNILQRQLGQLDPAEKKLYDAFVRIRDTFKKVFRPITDIIVEAVTGAVNRAGNVLKNPKFLSVFTELARAVAKGITQLSKYFTSKGFINSFLGFAQQAIQNLPSVIKIIENLTKAFIGLAKAGQPIVKDILTRVTNVTSLFSNAVNKKSGATQKQEPGTGVITGGRTGAASFIASAKPQLDAWIKLADAIGRVFRYLIQDSSGSGKGLVESLTNMFNETANFLKNHPEKVAKFFDGMKNSLISLSQVLFPLVKVLFSAFTGSNAEAFTKFTAQVVIPGLTLMLQLTGAFSRVLLFLTKIPGVKFFLQLLVAEKALNKVFPATQKVTDAIKKLVAVVGKDALTGFAGLRTRLGFIVQAMKNWIQASKQVILWMGRTALAITKSLIGALKDAIVQLGRFVFWMAVSAVNAAKAFAKALIESAIAGLEAFYTLIVDTVIPALVDMGIAMYAALGPWGLLALAIVAIIAVAIKFRKQVLEAIEFVFNWIKDHWKLLLVIFLAPFALAILAITKWHNKIFSIIKDVVNGIINFFKKLPGELIKVVEAMGHAFEQLPHLIVKALKDLPKLLVDLFKDIGKDIFNAMFDFLPKSVKDAIGKAWGVAKDLGGKAEGVVKGVLGHFASGGRIPGADGQAVPIIAHAGEWVLNKMQQSKLARRLNEGRQQVSAFLFGTNKSTDKPGPQTTGTKAKKSYPYKSYTLHEQIDQDGNAVWFIELDDGSYAQVTNRDAAKIKATHGNYIPGYIRRDSHGFTQHIVRAKNKARSYAMGGIVNPGMPTFAMGGVISSPNNSYGGSSVTNKRGGNSNKHIEQNFNVNTQGETDWNYVMRLAAMHAQGSM